MHAEHGQARATRRARRADVDTIQILARQSSQALRSAPAPVGAPSVLSERRTFLVSCMVGVEARLTAGRESDAEGASDRAEQRRASAIRCKRCAAVSGIVRKKISLGGIDLSREKGKNSGRIEKRPTCVQELTAWENTPAFMREGTSRASVYVDVVEDGMGRGQRDTHKC